ncbi:MAG: hypothetical protein HY548_06685, partial [Elusimicrobia bacterium]|nr:hypothetical protein [Elusimicrobiota bacterium]
TDNAVNVQSPVESTFVYDTEVPSGGVGEPKTLSGLQGHYRANQLTTLTGTAQDTTAGLVDTIEIRLSRDNAGMTEWFNPAGAGSWDATPRILSAATYAGVVWTATFPATAWLDGTTNYFSVQVEDKAGNRMAQASTNTFVVDHTSPTASLSLPGTAGGYYREFANVLGQISDTFAVKVTSVAIFNKGNNFYWDDSAPAGFKSPTIKWYMATGTKNWSLDATGWSGNLSEDLRLSVKSEDAAGNVQSTIFTRDFRIDNSTPTSQIDNVTDGEWRNSLTSINGTADDGTLGGLDGNKLRIRRHKDNTFWSGSGWGAETPLGTLRDSDDNTDFGGSSSEPWHFNFNDLNWRTGYTAEQISGSSFTMTSTARDLARDNSDVITPHEEDWTTKTSISFWYDIVKPTVTIASPANGTYQKVVPSLTGEAGDANSGIKQVQIRIREIGTGTSYYWTGFGYEYKDADDSTVWRTTAAATTFGYTHSWSYPYAGDLVPSWLPGKQYNVSVRAVDRATNQTDPSSYASSTFTYDNAEPIVYVNTAKTSAELNALATIAGTASDSFPLRVEVEVERLRDGAKYEMGINDFAVVGSSYNIASGWGSWTLAINQSALESGATYTIRARGVDQAGNVTTVDNSPVGEIRANILFDTTLPVSSVTFPTENAIFKAADLVSPIAGTASDPAPGSPAGAQASGIFDTRILLQRQDTLQYWNGAGWQGAEPGPWPSQTGPSVINWEYNLPSVSSMTSGGTYKVWSQAEDQSTNATEVSDTGNVENRTAGGPPTRTFRYDASLPQSFITAPNTSSRQNTINQILGTSREYPNPSLGITPAGIQSVFMNITQPDYNRYWDGDSWENAGGEGASDWSHSVSAVIDNLYTASATWHYDMPDVNFSSNRNYQVRVRAEDAAGSPGNYETLYSTRTFFFDNRLPPSNVTYPFTNAAPYFNTLTVITGTAGDGAFDEDIAQVRIRIQRQSDLQYWDGGGWSGATWNYGVTVINKSLPDLDEWSYPSLPVGQLNNGNTYYITVEATDWATNVQLSPPTTVYFDISKPTVGLTQPNQTYHRTLSQIQGAVGDLPFNIWDRVELKVQRQSDNQYWQGDGSWTGVETWRLSDNTVPASWQYPSAAFGADVIPNWVHGTTYTVIARAFDRTGAVSTVYSTRTFTYDVLYPTATITVPNASPMAGLPTVSVNAVNINEPSPLAVQGASVAYRLTGTGWWDPTSKVFGAPNNDDPPSSAWVPATLIGGSTWQFTVTGSSVPQFQDGSTYQILAKAVDQAGNETPRPTGTGFSSNWVEFSYMLPDPVVNLVTPVAG